MSDGNETVMRLFKPGAKDSFLAPHHLEAARRISQLAQRAQLRHKQTMTYEHRISAARASADDIPDFAYDARTRLNSVLKQLPAECAGVIWDICVFEQGLQHVEQARRWPRRSAKLILRIALEHLALIFGLTERAQGLDAARMNTWRQDGARPHVMG